jgi:hypothetical protein
VAALLGEGLDRIIAADNKLAACGRRRAHGPPASTEIIVMAIEDFERFGRPSRSPQGLSHRGNSTRKRALRCWVMRGRDPRAHCVVVILVRPHNEVQMAFAEDYDMINAFISLRT